MLLPCCDENNNARWLDNFKVPDCLRDNSRPAYLHKCIRCIVQGTAWFVAGGKARSGMTHADAWTFDIPTQTWRQMQPVLRSNQDRPLVLSLGSQAIEREGRIVILDPVTGKTLPFCA